MQRKYLLGACDYIIGRLRVIIRTKKVRYDGSTLNEVLFPVYLVFNGVKGCKGALCSCG